MATNKCIVLYIKHRHESYIQSRTGVCFQYFRHVCMQNNNSEFTVCILKQTCDCKQPSHPAKAKIFYGAACSLQKLCLKEVLCNIQGTHNIHYIILQIQLPFYFFICTTKKKSSLSKRKKAYFIKHDMVVLVQIDMIFHVRNLHQLPFEIMLKM